MEKHLLLSEKWNSLIVNNYTDTNNRKKYLFAISRYKKFNKTTFLKYLNESSFTFNSQYISLNILLFLETNKIFNGNRFNKIYQINKKKDIFVFINKKKIYLKKYQYAWRLLWRYFGKYYEKSGLIDFEKKILRDNFISSEGFTNNVTIEMTLNPKYFNLPRSRVDLSIELKNKKIIVIEFNENDHITREKCSLKPEERYLSIANGALMVDRKLDCIRILWEDVIFYDNKKKKKKFYELFDSIKNKLIINNIKKEEYIVNKINHYFGSESKIGTFIYQAYHNRKKFVIKLKNLFTDLKIKDENLRKKLIESLKEEERVFNSLHNKDSVIIKESVDDIDFFDSDSENEDDEEEKENLYLENNMVNFEGMIALLKYINLSNSFKPIQVKIAQDLLTNIFFNCIKAHEDLYDEVSSNSEFLKHIK